MDSTISLENDQMMPDSAADKRGAPRFISLIRAAKLVCGQGEFVCVIRDVSATGIGVRTFHRLPTDRAVALELQNGDSYELELVRQSGYEASYRFTSPIAVEHLIHEDWRFPKRRLRLNIVVPMTLSALTGSAEAVALNLSQQGARVECDHVFAIDQRVTISSPDFPEIRCKVRWRKDSNYGLVFEDTFTLRDFAVLAVKVQCPLLIENAA